MKMIAFELNKTVFKNKGVLLILLAVVIKLITLGTEDHAINSFTYENRAQYVPMVNAYAGKITEANSASIEAKFQAINEVEINITTLRQGYKRGETSETEYLNLSRALEVLKDHKDLFLTFYSQYLYVQEKPEERYLLYDDGWNALLSKERFDWGFVLLTIVLSASVFCREYETDMRTILIATKKGDTRLIAAKFVSILTTVVICSLIASLVEYLFFSLKFGLPHGDYPLKSLYYFKDSAFQLTLRQTFLLISAYRMFGLLMLSVLTMFISVWTQKTIVTLSASLMTVVLPYALPVKDSVKYLLPSPLGFILAQGFFRGTQMAEYTQTDEAVFNTISQSLQIRLVIGWLVLAGIMLFVIFRKFLSAAPILHFPKKWLAATLVLLFLICVMVCPSASVSRPKLDRVYNMIEEYHATVVGDELVTLEPNFRMENLQTHEIEAVIRDPFTDDETINQTVQSVFNHDGKLDYFVKTEDEIKLVELDLDTYKTSILYRETIPKDPALIIDKNSAPMYAEDYFTFFIDGSDLYLASNMKLRRINLDTGKDETIIKNLYPMRISYDGENIYYVTTMFEVMVYNVGTGEYKTIPDIRASVIYLRENKIYYRNEDENGTVYVYDIETGQNKLVIPESATNFVCDDDYLYYINQNDQGYLYRTDLQSDSSVLVAPFFGYNIQIIDDYPFVYYRAYGADLSTVQTYRIDKETLSYEKIEEYQKYE